jgi:ABC-2 type transport system permease protein
MMPPRPRHRELLDALALYRRLIAVSVRAQLQYPASFVLATVAHLIGTGLEFVGILALFDRFGAFSGWTLPEVAFFYGISDLTFACADALGHGFDDFGSMIRSGDFDRVLLRPRSAVLQLLGQELTLKRVGRMTQAVLVLGWASHAGGIDWSAARALLLIAAVAGGVCLFLGLVILQATSAFWTTETLEIWNAFTYGGNCVAQYPLPIYQRWFRRFFLVVVPLGCVGYLPGIAILGRADPLGLPAITGWLSPLAGVGFLVAALGAWRLGVRHYASTGS